MTAFTPDVRRNITRYAGILPREELARRLGITLSLVDRVARDEKLDLRIRLEPVELAPSPLSCAGNSAKPRMPADERHTATFLIHLRESDAKILRDKAKQRFIPPSRLIRQIVEGAIARGKVDELVGAAQFYPRGNGASASAQTKGE